MQYVRVDSLRQNKSHGLGAMHLKKIIKTNHVQLKSRISCQWFTKKMWNILVKSTVSCGLLMLISMTDKCMHSSMKLGNIDYV